MKARGAVKSLYLNHLPLPSFLHATAGSLGLLATIKSFVPLWTTLHLRHMKYGFRGVLKPASVFRMKMHCAFPSDAYCDRASKRPAGSMTRSEYTFAASQRGASLAA